jgi:hypothetical protein
MKKTNLTRVLFCLISTGLFSTALHSQETISWLSDYIGDVSAGSNSYKYVYTTVDNNACKLKIEEQKTDKKAVTTSKSYVLYLSDLDPSTFSFKPSGSTIIVNLATKAGQKFISVYSGENMDEYTASISVYFDAVDKARSYIDAIKLHAESCKSSDISWANRDEAYNWLNKNVGESSNSGTLVKQAFTKGKKSYLAQLEIEKTSSKGTEKVRQIFDLSDINAGGIVLKVSGKTLKIDMPVKGNEYYIQNIANEQTTTYEKGTEIYSDDLEVARNVVRALNYLVSTAQPERKEWKEYAPSLAFVKENLKEVSVGSGKVAQTLNYAESTSGIASLKLVETDSKGVQTEEINSFYLTDLSPNVKLEVTSKNAYILLETKDKNKFIKQTRDDKTLGYSASVKVYADDIDEARDLITALEFAIKNSTDGVQEFGSTQKAIDWLTKIPGDVTIDTKSYHQTIQINPNAENQIDLNIITSDAAGAGVNERYVIYPEDLTTDDMKIKVSGKKLYVPVSTGKFKYIKYFKGDAQQNYTDDLEVLFEDVQQARNFIAAMTALQSSSKVAERTMNNNMAAYSFLQENITAVETAGVKQEQKIEQQESDVCKLKYTRSQTDSKGVTTEYSYDFILSDIDPGKSLINISGKEVQINLVTKEKQKLIKPYKNGEAGAFIYDFDIAANDVLTAKKILASFITLAKGCK